jgi:nucleoid-associated protein YgaU
MSEALKQLETLLGNAAAGSKPFPPNSRYNSVATLVWTTPDGREIPYLARRFVPPPERFNTLGTHTVVAGDRLDNLAARYLGDPEQYWKLCDANGALRPDELVEAIGRSLRIALPEGVTVATGVA